MTGTINAIVFPGGFNLPLWAAEKQGFFAKRALDVRLHPTQNSMEQLTGLIDGKWDIAFTGFDNVVAYQEGQGEAAASSEPDLFVFMGGDDAFLRLVVQPAIHDPHAVFEVSGDPWELEGADGVEASVWPGRVGDAQRHPCASFRKQDAPPGEKRERRPEPPQPRTGNLVPALAVAGCAPGRQ